MCSAVVTVYIGQFVRWTFIFCGSGSFNVQCQHAANSVSVEGPSAGLEKTAYLLNLHMARREILLFLCGH